jgi:hypothetical protein
LQLSLELGSCHLRDRARGVRELTRYKNNYKALNVITIALGRNVYDRVSYLETAHDVWLKLCNTYEGSFEIKSYHKDIYNRQYQIFLRNLVNH